MKTPDRRLLQEVLRDDDYDTLRAELNRSALDALRGGVRTRRRRAAASWTAACLVAVLAGSLWWPRPDRVSVPIQFQLVQTTPTVPKITSEVFSALDVVQTRTWSAEANVATRATEFMNDEELLESFAGHPTAMVAVSPGHKRLFFLDPADQARFMVNEL